MQKFKQDIDPIGFEKEMFSRIMNNSLPDAEESMKAMEELGVGEEFATAMGLLQKASNMMGLDKKGIDNSEIPTDDGTVKGLIWHGGDRRTGDFVLVKLSISGKTAYSIFGGSISEESYIFSKENDPHSNFDEAEAYIKKIVTATRRKLKKNDILLCSMEDDWYNDDPVSGIVLTETEIFVMDQGKLDYIIEYAEIKDVDFDKDTVKIVVEDGEKVSLFCVNENEYAEEMFNLLMDIKERIEG